MALPYLRSVPGGVELAVLVQPRASRTRIVGEHSGMLKIQLAAPPVDGEANAALIEFLARHFGLPKRQVSLAAGDAARRKRVVLQGLDAARAEAVISASP